MILFINLFSVRHNDFPLTIRAVTQNNLSAFDFNSDLSQAEGFKTHNACHTDLPKLRQGRVGGQVGNKIISKISVSVSSLLFNDFQFWSAYVDCSAQYKDAVQMFIEQIDVIHRLVE